MSLYVGAVLELCCGGRGVELSEPRNVCCCLESGVIVPPTLACGEACYLRACGRILTIYYRDLGVGLLSCWCEKAMERKLLLSNDASRERGGWCKLSHSGVMTLIIPIPGARGSIVTHHIVQNFNGVRLILLFLHYCMKPITKIIPHLSKRILPH